MARKTGSSSKLYRIFFKDQVPAGRRQRTQFPEPPMQQPEHQPFEPPAQHGEFQVQQPVWQPEYQPEPTVLETEYQPPQPEYQPPQQEVYCTNCGRKNEGHAAFCIGCGTNLF